MSDYFLKATDEATLWACLVEAGAATTYEVKNEDGEVVDTRYAPAPGYSIDVIGTIYRPTGNLIQQTGPGDAMIEVPEMAPLEGFHANLRGPEFVAPEPTEVVTPSPLADLLVTPSNPARVWF
jgi:hypothetical protein